MLEGYFLDLAWLLGSLFFGVLLRLAHGSHSQFSRQQRRLDFTGALSALLELGIPLASVAAIISQPAPFTLSSITSRLPSLGHRTVIPPCPRYRAIECCFPAMLPVALLGLHGGFATRFVFVPPTHHRSYYLWTRTGLVRRFALNLTVCVVVHFFAFCWPRKPHGWTGRCGCKNSREGSLEGIQGLLASLRPPPFSSLPACTDGSKFTLGTFPIGMPDASLLLPSLAGLFGIANLLDIYATTSHLPPQREIGNSPVQPLVVPCFWPSVAASMGVLPGMTASQATVLVMGGRNLAAKAQGKQGFGMDWETRRLTRIER